MTISRVSAVGPVTGRLVDSQGSPLTPGTDGWFGVQINYCAGEYGCGYGAGGIVHPDGSFLIPAQSYLMPGDYVLTVDSDSFERYESERFTLALDTPKDLGAVPLRRLPTIVGSVVDGDSGAPLNPYADNVALNLYKCAAGDCTYFAFGSLNYDGTFMFGGRYYTPLEPGSYRLDITATGYEPRSVGPFTLAAEERENLGPIALTPLPTIQGVTGRVLDAETNRPPPTDSVWAYLESCTGTSCYTTAAYAPVEADGRFSFNAGNAWRRLTVGSYRVRFQGERYRVTFTPRFSVAADELFDLRVLKVQPCTVQWEGGWICASVPPGRQRCEYGANLKSIYSRTVQVRVWSSVTVNPYYGYGDSSTTFQPAPARLVQIRPGATVPVNFAIDIARQMPEEATMCVQLFAAPEGPGYLFNPLASTPPYGNFCVVKQTDGTVRRLTAEELRALQQRDRGPRP